MPLIFEKLKTLKKNQMRQKYALPNYAKKNDKLTNNDLQNTTQKTKDWATQTPLSRGWTRVLWKGRQFLFHM